MHGTLGNPNTTGTGNRRRTRYAWATLIAATLALAAAAGIGAIHQPHRAGPDGAAAVEVPALTWNPSRFLLNALLASALDADAVPLRWVDPRTALGCGPNSAVLVDRAALTTGALVPDTPFELDWLADGCYPFGADGPRLDGRIRMTVFREDWGFSAVVEPFGFRLTSPRGEIRLAAVCGASMPQDPAADDPMELTEFAANEALACGR